MLTANSFTAILAALVLTIGAILLLSRVARSSGLAQRFTGHLSTGRMTILETVALDRARRLHLVRCDGRDMILLTGGAADVMVGWVPVTQGSQGQ